MIETQTVPHASIMAITATTRTMGFEYNKIDTEDVRSVDIVPLDDPGYRSFMRDIYDSPSSETQYEKWARECPELARKFQSKAERALANPSAVASEINEAVFRLKHDQLKDVDPDVFDITGYWRKYAAGDDLRYVVQYPNHAERYGLWVYEDDEYTERTVKRAANGLLDDLRGRNGEDEQRKACLKYAYSETFETSDKVGDHVFNQSREEGLLRHLNSDQSREAGSKGDGGVEFESEVREVLSEEYDLPLRDPVFRIQLASGDTTYKVMDVHTRIGGTPLILEAFTQRIPKKKKEQLDNYIELYHMATGFRPDGYLVTDELIRTEVNEEGEVERISLGYTEPATHTLEHLLEHLDNEYDIE